MNPKTQAEIWRKCLELGLIPISDVVAWADQLIEQSAKPESAWIELSMAGNLQTSEVAKLLDDIPGQSNPDLVYQGLFSTMQRTLINRPETENVIAYALFQMAFAGDIPDKASGSTMFWFSDALDLAKAGVTGNVEEIRRELHAFLNQYAGNAFQEDGNESGKAD